MDDTGIAESNKSPVVEYSKDRLGPMQDAFEHVFYIYTPTIHWHVVPLSIEDLSTRQVIKRLVDEAHPFG